MPVHSPRWRTERKYDESFGWWLWLVWIVRTCGRDRDRGVMDAYEQNHADRARGRMPDLHRANASFAAKLVKYVRDRYDGDAPRVYHAARINRKTYSAIVGNELRPVSKRTAVAFAFALELPRDEADDLLQSAGFALSPSILEDMVFAACLDAGIHDLDRVNRILEAHGARPFLLQKG